MALLGYSKRVVYIVAEEGRKKGIVCPQCGSSNNITAELCFSRFRIQECGDCGYSSDRFVELRKMKSNA